jgi:hypothetical protein
MYCPVSASLLYYKNGVELIRDYANAPISYSNYMSSLVRQDVITASFLVAKV